MTRITHVHEAIAETGPWPFRGPVAVAPYTDENPAAHGNVGYTERCSCGHERYYLANGNHVEYGPWHERSTARANRLAKQEREQEMEARRTRADEIVAAAERDAVGRLPARLLVQASEGIELDITGADAAALLRDSTMIGVTLSRPWPPTRSRCTLGDLRRSARDWADATGEPAHDLYAAIAAALP